MLKDNFCYRDLIDENERCGCVSSCNSCHPKPRPPKPCCCIGPQGPAGPQGPRGLAGSRGIAGPQGPTGPMGATGAGIDIMGVYETLEELISAHPTGSTGDAYVVDGIIYVWDTATSSWQPAGSVGVTGPTGATGAGIVILGVYESLAELIEAHPTGNAGDAYVADGIIYVWDTAASAWTPAGNVGATGPTGATGAGIDVLGVYDTLAALTAAHPTGNAGDAYVVDGVIYVWDTETDSWQSAGNTGVTGATGAVGTILGSYDTLADLETAHPTGNQGDAYLVDGMLYVWNTETQSWESVGSLRAPAAPVEIQFSSVTAPRVVSGALGEREIVNVVGLGFEEIASVADPLILNHPAISIKTISGGTITEIHVALSVSIGSGELTGSTVYAQLYTASPLNSREFYPVPDTLMTLELPMYPPIGLSLTESLTDLSIDIAPETQLILGFYNTSNDLSFGINAYLSGVIKLS